MNWVDDPQAESVMKELSLIFEKMDIATELIDVKLSRRNTARLKSLDLDNVESIQKTILKGGPIPAIVVRRIRLANGLVKYVIAGGNHRHEGLIRQKETLVRAYVVECNDNEFTVLCRMLNVVVGSGADKALRISQAYEAISTKAMDFKAACKAFNVPESPVRDHIKQVELGLKLYARLGSASQNLAYRVKKALSNVTSEVLLNRLLDLCKALPNSSKECAEIIAQAKSLNTEKEQLAYLDAKITEVVSEGEKAVKSKKRTLLYEAVSKLESLVGRHGVRRIEDADMVDGISEMRSRCRKLASILNSL